MVRHAPIHRRSGHSDIAICCGRNVRGSSPSTSVVPLSNQVTTLNHKRFKGFKMFSDRLLDPAQKDEDENDDEDQPEAAGWIVAPAGAIGPRRQRADENQDQDNE